MISFRQKLFILPVTFNFSSSIDYLTHGFFKNSLNINNIEFISN